MMEQEPCLESLPLSQNCFRVIKISADLGNIFFETQKCGNLARIQLAATNSVTSVDMHSSPTATHRYMKMLPEGDTHLYPFPSLPFLFLPPYWYLTSGRVINKQPSKGSLLSFCK